MRLFREFGMFAGTRLRSHTRVRCRTCTGTVGVRTHAVVSVTDGRFLPTFVGCAGALTSAVGTIGTTNISTAIRARTLGRMDTLVTRAGTTLSELMGIANRTTTGRRNRMRTACCRARIIPTVSTLHAPISGLRVVISGRT